MIPRKTIRGQEALLRLKIYEGIPVQFEKANKQVVPYALRYLHGHNHQFTKVGTISKRFGWKYSEVVKNLEQKRVVKASDQYEKKKKAIDIKKLALKNKKMELMAIEEKMSKFMA